MKVALNGAAGAMGRLLVGLIIDEEDCELVAAIERADHPDIGRDAGSLSGHERLGVPLSAELTAPADVMLDFSVPEATLMQARVCAERGIAMVIGTTGLSEQQSEEIRERVAARVPVLMAPNMSIGVNMLYELVERVAGALPGGYDVEIVEAHHRRKKDAPSGTAMELLRRVAGALGRQPDAAARFGRRGACGPRSPEEIGVHAIRGGDVVGDHTVIFAGEGERLELTHRATSRLVFARGALAAARFLEGQPPGLYSMRDVLG